MSPHQRDECVKAIIELARQNALISQANHEAMTTVRRMLETTDAPPDPPADEHQEILSVWDNYPEGTRLTREQIADALKLSRDNGTLAKRLRDMVRTKQLANDRHPPGYYPID